MNNKLMLKILLMILMVVIIVIVKMSKEQNKNSAYSRQWNYIPREEDIHGRYEHVDEQEYNIVQVENIQTTDVLLEVTDTSEITSIRKAQIKMSREIFECMDESYGYYCSICSRITVETWKWRQDKMVKMVSRLMVTDLTIEEYVMACFTSVALAATMGQSGQSNSQKLKKVSINDIMNFDYLYMKYTSVWLKFCVVLLTKERYDRLSAKCAVLAKNIVNIHGEENIKKLAWDWEVTKGINTIQMEKWVKNSYVLLDSQNKTSVLSGDLKWWEAQGVTDIRSDKQKDGCTMLSASSTGCNHVDYLLIMGKVQVLDRKMSITFGCRKCVTAEITEEMEKDQDRIWIIL